MSVRRIAARASSIFLLAATPVLANNVITDWDEKGVAFVTPKSNSPMAQRAMAIMHAAMYDSVTSIEPLYRPYQVRLPAAPGTSKEAAAAAAAGAALAALYPAAAADVKGAVSTYLGAIPDSRAKDEGIKLGEEVAAKIIEARLRDGADDPDAYRPKTAPGAYVPTLITVGSSFATMKPFVLASPSQFRPGPPVALTSEEWATDYNEIKEYGGKTSTKRTARQTENARFWLMTGPQSLHPLARQIATAKGMSVTDSARFITLVALAGVDAYVAVFDAKYHYDFWRPITAIRNGDIDGNPATERDATWQPIDNTPLHPEYPCAHCIVSGAGAAAIEALLGGPEIPEVTMTSPTAPGATHRWTNTRAYADEIAEARIWAGFHYRFSTVAGSEVGRKIGAYVVRNAMQPMN